MAAFIPTEHYTRVTVEPMPGDYSDDPPRYVVRVDGRAVSTHDDRRVADDRANRERFALGGLKPGARVYTYDLVSAPCTVIDYENGRFLLSMPPFRNWYRPQDITLIASDPHPSAR
jgi:hypothetical protein